MDFFAILPKKAKNVTPTLHHPTRFCFNEGKDSLKRKKTRWTGSGWEQDISGTDLHLSTLHHTPVG
jgi:hypothetical protein